ncbi:MAG: LPS export ABC transporter periplasmic protein LptC [Elainellaceae cyanobacterium]
MNTQNWSVMICHALFISPNRMLKLLLIGFTIAGLSVGAASCRDRPTAEVESDEEVSDPERNLTFDNITLEQSGDGGEVVWRMTADQAIYSQDRQTADVVKPSGDFLRDGEPTLKIQAERGQVLNDGERIILKGEVIATDVESGAVLRGDEMEWSTGDDLVVVRNNVVGTHPDFSIAADEARAAISEERIEVSGNVVAVSKEKDLQLAAEELVWFLEEERLVSDRPIRIQQLEGRRVTARATGDSAEFDMASQVARLEKNAVVIAQEPPIRLEGDAIEWNLENSTIRADERFTVTHRQEQVTMTADQGQGNLTTQVFRMNGNVIVVAQQNQGRLTSNKLTWTIPTQEILAEGDVVYRQTDPVFNLRGEVADGKLENQTIVVSGGRVITEFVPETSN